MQSLGYSTLTHLFFPALNWKCKRPPNKQIMTNYNDKPVHQQLVQTQISKLKVII